MYIGRANVATASLTTLTIPACEQLFETTSLNLKADGETRESRSSRAEDDKSLSEDIYRSVPFIHKVLESTRR